MPHETAARASQVLALNIEDLGLDARRVPVQAVLASYDRARILFTRYTGWQLHQLRHAWVSIHAPPTPGREQKQGIVASTSSPARKPARGRGRSRRRTSSTMPVECLVL